MKQKQLIIGNWKMNPRTVLEAQKLFDDIKKEVAVFQGTDVAVCPPFVFLSGLSALNSGKEISLGAQNVSSEEEGACTGEISVGMLKTLSVKFAIIGHSERRAMGETDEMVSKKVVAAVKAGLTAVLCVGERERDHESAFLQILKEQIIASLSGISERQLKNVVIAYEPVWAIGAKAKGVVEPEALLETIIFIRKVLSDLYSQKTAHAMKILYGGSVDEKNAGSFLKEGGANGLLVGRASLNAKKFVEILKIADNI